MTDRELQFLITVIYSCPVGEDVRRCGLYAYERPAGPMSSDPTSMEGYIVLETHRPSDEGDVTVSHAFANYGMTTFFQSATQLGCTQGAQCSLVFDPNAGWDGHVIMTTAQGVNSTWEVAVPNIRLITP